MFDVAPPWLVAARQELNVREYAGEEHNNPRILEYWKMSRITYRVHTDEVPWCAAFVGAWLEVNGIRGTRLPNARSYLKWGVRTKPRRGCIVVTKRGKSSWEGHVCFLVSIMPDGRLLVLGGNQSDSVSLMYVDPRTVLDYRWPEEYADEHTDLPRRTYAPDDAPVPSRRPNEPVGEVGDWQTWTETEEELRRTGSRTIESADAATRAVTRTVGGGVVIDFAKEITDAVSPYLEGYQSLHTTTDTLKSALTWARDHWWVVAIVAAAVVVVHLFRIVHARVDDARSGRHIGGSYVDDQGKYHHVRGGASDTVFADAGSVARKLLGLVPRDVR